MITLNLEDSEVAALRALIKPLEHQYPTIFEKLKKTVVIEKITIRRISDMGDYIFELTWLDVAGEYASAEFTSLDHVLENVRDLLTLD